MTLDARAQSVGLFVRGLTNLKALLVKVEGHIDATGGGEPGLLDARLAAGASAAPADLHAYTLAAHVHWAAEGARLAIAHLLGAPSVPVASDETNFADLHRRIEATIASFREVRESDLEAGLDREIVIELPRGSIRCGGGQFLVAYAIPHFYYHVTTVYGILRNQGVHLTMGDFLGNWEKAERSRLQVRQHDQGDHQRAFAARTRAEGACRAARPRLRHEPATEGARHCSGPSR